MELNITAHVAIAIIRAHIPALLASNHEIRRIDAVAALELHHTTQHSAFPDAAVADEQPGQPHPPVDEAVRDGARRGLQIAHKTTGFVGYIKVIQHAVVCESLAGWHVLVILAQNSQGRECVVNDGTRHRYQTDVAVGVNIIGQGICLICRGHSIGDNAPFRGLVACGDGAQFCRQETLVVGDGVSGRTLALGN